jgi:hypothetical protein
MFVGQGPTQDPESMKIVLLLIATSVAVFWRTVIKLALIVAIMLIILGALALTQSLH